MKGLVVGLLLLFAVPVLVRCQEPPVTRWPAYPVVLIPTRVDPASRAFLAKEWDAQDTTLAEPERAYCGLAVRYPGAEEMVITNVRRMPVVWATPWSVLPGQLCRDNEVPIHTHPRNTCNGDWDRNDGSYVVTDCVPGGDAAYLCWASTTDQNYHPESSRDVSGVQCDRNAVVFYRALLPSDRSRFADTAKVAPTVNPPAPKKPWWKLHSRL